jgi:hypothetical protein
MRKTKDNHMIIGSYPSGDFINYAGKKMQNPPKTKVFRHATDVYTVEEVEQFLNEMMPDFYERLSSLEQFEQWLLPRYSPNLIVATREDDLPSVMARLGVHYFLRFEVATLPLSWAS